MRVKVQDPAVRDNLGFLADIAGKIDAHQEKEVFEACVDCATGRFCQKELSGKSKSVWIEYRYDPEIGEVVFEVLEGDKDSRAFDTEEMAPSAYQILAQSLAVFNQLCHQLKGPSSQKTKLSVLSHLLVEEASTQDDAVLAHSWHPVDRPQAEEMLLMEPRGTFLFRKDEFTWILEEELEGQLDKPIKCVTLTYKADEEKIAELILVHCDHVWLIYDNDPLLEGRRYKELNEVLVAQGTCLRIPLLKNLT